MHKQFNGSGWMVYTEKQPGYACSTADCSECDTITKDLEAKEAARLATHEETKKKIAEVTAAENAVKASIQAQTDLDNRVSLLRSQAINKATLAKVATLEKENAGYVAYVEEIKAKTQALLDTALENHNKILAQADSDLAEALAIVEKTDWKAEASK